MYNIKRSVYAFMIVSSIIFGLAFTRFVLNVYERSVARAAEGTVSVPATDYYSPED